MRTIAMGAAVVAVLLSAGAAANEWWGYRDRHGYWFSDQWYGQMYDHFCARADQKDCARELENEYPGFFERWFGKRTWKRCRESYDNGLRVCPGILRNRSRDRSDTYQPWPGDPILLCREDYWSNTLYCERHPRNRPFQGQALPGRSPGYRTPGFGLPGPAPGQPMYLPECVYDPYLGRDRCRGEGGGSFGGGAQQRSVPVQPDGDLDDRVEWYAECIASAVAGGYDPTAVCGNTPF